MGLPSYAAIVADYRLAHRPAAREEAEWFAAASLTPAGALERAALSIVPSRISGRLVLHAHQCRLGHDRMAAVAGALEEAADAIYAAGDFAALIAAVEDALRAVPGVGDLAIYDIAHRIGLYRGIAPQQVYLHAGARRGARALGLSWRARTLEIGQLPAEFHGLSASEIEDVLCLYAEDIERIVSGRPRVPVRKGCARYAPPPPRRRCGAGLVQPYDNRRI